MKFGQINTVTGQLIITVQSRVKIMKFSYLSKLVNKHLL